MWGLGVALQYWMASTSFALLLAVFPGTVLFLAVIQGTVLLLVFILAS